MSGTGSGRSEPCSRTRRRRSSARSYSSRNNAATLQERRGVFLCEWQYGAGAAVPRRIRQVLGLLPAVQVLAQHALPAEQGQLLITKWSQGGEVQTVGPYLSAKVRQPRIGDTHQAAVADQGDTAIG